MTDLQREKSDYINQMMGKRLVSYNGVFIPVAIDIIRKKEEEQERNDLRSILHIIHEKSDDNGNSDEHRKI